MQKKSYGVLILHGFTSSLDCVNEVQPPVEALGLPTRMPVLRGHGAESPDAMRGVAWTDWVADAEAALTDLLTEAERVIVFGHSMGGLVTLILAADHPDVVDSIVVAAAAVQISNPLAPGHPLHFLAPLATRLIDKVDLPPTYADPALAEYDTNYAWAPVDAVAALFDFAKTVRRRLPEVRVPALIMHSRKDTTIDPVSAEIVYNGISTPPDQKHITWYEVTEHEMFRDCESDATVAAVVEYVRERAGLSE